jgi:uncharacterized protein YndB with AHSA1/START domain
MTEHPYDIEITRVFDAPPERVYQAFTDPDQFARWYGPVGFPVHRDTVEVDARVGGRQRFEMVSEADPSMRTGFDGRFDEVVHNELLPSSGAWDGIPGQGGAWPSNLRVEFHDDDGRTRLVVREGPPAHPAPSGPNRRTGSRPGPWSSWRSRLMAALISDRWVNAWGKLPSCSPVWPISSAYRPRWLA